MTLTARERLMLEGWLNSFAPLGREVHEQVRYLLANHFTLAGEALEGRTAALRRIVEAYGQQWPSAENTGAPLGRRRRPGGLVQEPVGALAGIPRPMWFSPWERVWLQVDELQQAGMLAGDPLPAIAALRAREVGTNTLDAVGLVAVCGYPAQSARMARNASGTAGLTPGESVWLRWLGGEPIPALELAAALPFGEEFAAFRPAVLQAAIRGDWRTVLTALPARFIKPRKKAPAASDALGGTVLAMLARFQLNESTDRAGLIEALQLWLGWYGESEKGEDQDRPTLSDKLVHVYLYRQLADAEVPPAVVLQRIGLLIPYLKDPPPRTFQVPEAVRVPLTELLQLCEAALRDGKSLHGRLLETGNEFEVH